jgi:DNA repair protein SbcD/Mre11
VIRLLHTSDWHLGLELGGHDRLDEQKLFLAWLLDTCKERSIDALLVCGDVYDVANPSVAAQSAFARFVVDLRRALPAMSVVVVAGNHDSGVRLELPRPFAEALGALHLVGSVAAAGKVVERHLLALPGKDGTPAAWCLAVPFVRAGDIDCKVQEGETVDQAFSRSVGTFYRELSREAQRRNPSLPVVAMGHLTLAGSDKAGSERILIGGVESVSVAALAEGADYVALGHIHRCQTVGREAVRYCGSPLAMDFDERRHVHRVLLVDLEAAGAPPVVRPVEVPEFVPLLRLPEKPGTWSDLEKAVTEFDWSGWTDAARDLQPLVELRFRSEGAEADLRERTEALCKGRPFRLVGSPRRIGGGDGAPVAAGASATDLRALDAPQELFVRHWTRKHGVAPPDGMLECFREVVDALAVQGRRP